MLPKRYIHSESEKKWQKFWQEHSIFRFKTKSQNKVFSIDTPPPTVNGKIHIGHIFSYCHAEIIARYMRMNGYNVFYPFGFDDNGLPTERLVEKKNDIKASDTTREEFSKLCLKETASLEEQFKNIFTSAGFSCDWDYQYSTISRKAQIASQKSFIDLYKNGHLYFANAPALWCTECQTAIAQAELENKELPSVFNYIKFFIEGEDKFIEVATTRPELLASCKRIFVHPDDERFKDFVGKKVIVPIFGFKVLVVQDEKVDMQKGTGAVMCCTFGDITDLEWYKKYSFSFTQSILENGRMSDLCGKYSGSKIKTARADIIEDLIKQDLLIKQEKIVHNVSTHERCGTPMEITVKKQWFIDILSHKKDFIDLGNKINWFPQHMKMRYLNWVENLQWDWCISRQRYFGVPFPVWYCKNCGEIIVADVEDLPVNPIAHNPDKPCPKCKSTDFAPETDIMDTWATSSMTPFINLDWHDEEKFKKQMFPMSLRPNAHDIIRTWDFYTIVKAFYHQNDIPWKNVMISGHVMADKNQKISKRKENSKHDPQTVLETYSADCVRCWAATGSLGGDIVFSESEFLNKNKLITKIWNAAKFCVMHLEGFDKKDADGNSFRLDMFSVREEIKLFPMDVWIIEKFNAVYDRYCKYFENYEVGLAFVEIEKFFWKFCDDYIEVVKSRLYNPEVYGDMARKSGLFACYHVFLGMIKCFAVYMPHITEEIYQDYFSKIEREKSIHICNMQKIDLPENTESCSRLGDKVIEIIGFARRYKSEHNISLKSEIQKIEIKDPDFEELKKYSCDIISTCSCKELTFSQSDKEQLDVAIL